MNPVRVDVATPSRAYTVSIEDDAIDRIGTILDEAAVPRRRFVVSSPLVWRLHGRRFARAVSGAEPLSSNTLSRLREHAWRRNFYGMWD